MAKPTTLNSLPADNRSPPGFLVGPCRPGAYRLSVIKRAASHLSAAELHVLLLSAVEGRSNGEIARELGVSPRRAETLLARALLKFDASLGDDSD